MGEGGNRPSVHKGDGGGGSGRGRGEGWKRGGAVVGDRQKPKIGDKT